MRRFKLSAFLVLAALVVASIGSAALSTVRIDRTVTGKVLVDTDANVAVKFENTSGYSNAMTTAANGKVSFDLNAMVGKNSAAQGFNTDATYSLGTTSKSMFKVTNNSDIPVTVTLDNTANSNKLVLLPITGSNATIPVGGASEFYFTLDTTGLTTTSAISATLTVKN